MNDDELREMIDRDIGAICSIYRTVGEAMFSEARTRLAERIAHHVGDELRRLRLLLEPGTAPAIVDALHATAERYGWSRYRSDCPAAYLAGEIDRLRAENDRLARAAKKVCDDWELYGDVGVAEFARLRDSIPKEPLH